MVTTTTNKVLLLATCNSYCQATTSIFWATSLTTAAAATTAFSQAGLWATQPTLGSGFWAPRPLHHQHQQRLYEPLLLSYLGPARQRHVTNSSGYKSRCCSRLWILRANATSLTAAAATRAAAALVSELSAPRPHQQQQQRLHKPLLSSLSLGRQCHITNSSSG